MSSEYDLITAYHYAQYRPALHEVILGEILEGQSFPVGLDIGCGTGNSAVALTAYCDHILAVDTSQSMLKVAKQHAQITYQLCFGLNEVEGIFDIITFAGSLPYLKSQSLIDHLNRLLADKGWIVIYDFDIQLDSILEELPFEIPDIEGVYDHYTNLSDLNCGNLSFVDQKTVSTNITPSSVEIMHLILSVKEYYLALKNYFLEDKIENSLMLAIEEQMVRVPQRLEATYNYSIYRKRRY